MLKKKMMSLICVSLICSGLLSNKIHAMDAQRDNLFLNPDNRPTYVTENIDTADAAIKKHKVESWIYGGRPNYQIISLTEDNRTIDGYINDLLRKLSYQDQPVINILDIGAGNFTWGRYLAKRINEYDSLPKNLVVNILSLRGEPYDGEEISQVGNCKLYEFGSFKIEDLHRELKQRVGLDLNGQIHLAVSSWTFVYFMDPLGVLQHLLNLLNPGNGLALINQWDETIQLRYHGEDSAITKRKMGRYFYKAFVDSGLDVLICPYNNAWVIKRETSNKITLPFGYNPIAHEIMVQNSDNIASTGIEANPWYVISKNESIEQLKMYWNELSGSQVLFNELLRYNPNFSKNISSEDYDSCISI